MDIIGIVIRPQILVFSTARGITKQIIETGIACLEKLVFEGKDDTAPPVCHAAAAAWSITWWPALRFD